MPWEQMVQTFQIDCCWILLCRNTAEVAALRAQLEGLQTSLAADANTAMTTMRSEVRHMHGCCIPGIVLSCLLLQSQLTQCLQAHLAAMVP